MTLYKVRNMESPRTGKPVANQFILTANSNILGNFNKQEIFQSYDSIIAVVTRWSDKTEVELDETYWNYSRTTSKYRNEFLGESTKETEAKIKSGEYKLVNLNK